MLINLGRYAIHEFINYTVHRLFTFSYRIVTVTEKARIRGTVAVIMTRSSLASCCRVPNHYVHVGYSALVELSCSPF